MLPLNDWAHYYNKPGMGITKLISLIQLFSQFFSIIKTLVIYFEYHIGLSIE